MKGRSMIVRTGQRAGAKLDLVQTPTVYPCEVRVRLQAAGKQVCTPWTVYLADERAHRYLLAKIKLLLHEMDGIFLEASKAGQNAGERTAA